MAGALRLESGRSINPDEILRSSDILRGVNYLHSPLKRRLDMFMGGALSVGALIPIGLLASAVWLQDRKNPIYKGTRINPGIVNRVPIIKIRSMVVNGDALEDQVVGISSILEIKTKSADPRITPFGKWMRRTSLDELPQLLLACKGDISLVGPRMFNDSEWNREIFPNMDEEPYLTFYNLLQQGMKFGVTGFYGIYGRSNLALRDRVALDNLYGNDANFTADWRIMGLTVGAVLSARGVF